MNSRAQDHSSAEPGVPSRRAGDATAGDATATEAIAAAAIAAEAIAGCGPEASLSGLPKIVKFAALARCGDEIWIENEGQIYRLRKTRQGKLILTK